MRLWDKYMLRDIALNLRKFLPFFNLTSSKYYKIRIKWKRIILVHASLAVYPFICASLQIICFARKHKRKWQRGENGRYKNTWRLLTLRSQPFLRLTEIYSTRVVEKLSGETTRPPIRNKSELTLGASSRTKPIVRGPGGADFGVGMDRALPSVKYPYSLNHNSRRAFSFFLFLSKCHSFMSYKASGNHETRTAVIESRWRKRARAIREETRHPVLVTIAIVTSE